MSKAEQLIEYIIRDIMEFSLLDDEIDVKEAMSRFYDSEVSAKLHDTETGLYLSGSSYVYDLFRDERDNGRIIQREI